MKTVYQSHDGCLFDRPELCLRHEAEIEARAIQQAMEMFASLPLRINRCIQLLRLLHNEFGITEIQIVNHGVYGAHLVYQQMPRRDKWPYSPHHFVTELNLQYGGGYTSNGFAYSQVKSSMVAVGTYRI